MRVHEDLRLYEMDLLEMIINARKPKNHVVGWIISILNIPKHRITSKISIIIIFLELYLQVNEKELAR